MMDKIKFLLADTSPVYRKIFGQAIMEAAPGAQIVIVHDRAGLIDKIHCGDYDIIVLDALFLEPDGAGLLSEIECESPKAAVLITAGSSKKNDILLNKIQRNSAAGFMAKPIYESYNENFTIVKRKIAELLKTLNRSRAQEPPEPGVSSRKTQRKINKLRFYPEIVLIAASTGGPVALGRIFSALGPDFPVPILVVQHISQAFTGNLTRDLTNETKLKVKSAENGESPEAGTIYIAPGGTHMTLDRHKRILLNDAPAIRGLKPSADVLFASVAENCQLSGVLAIILTGMGRDGLKGVLTLKEKQNCYCIIQSENTCVIYGMPRAIEEKGLADSILDIDKIAGEMEEFHFSRAQSKKELGNGVF